MKKEVLSILLAFAVFGIAEAQRDSNFNYASVTGAVGDSQGSGSLEYFHIWTLGKANRLQLGVGGRFTSYFGSNQYYTSAPASLANDDAKVDSLLLQSPQSNSLNLAVNIGYRIATKFDVGFNIDVIGFSFGSEKSGSFLSETQGNLATASPTSGNVLLVGNNDRGMLNSEFYLRYYLNDKWGIKGAFQYLFTEYTTDTKVQQQPESNDRFRNKASMFSLGITRTF